MSGNVFVGRQPIFDREGNIYAYELLYRNSDHNEYPNINPEKATLELLIHTFLTIGFDDVANRTKSFVNFSEKLLYEDVIEQLDRRYVIIEILENIEITPLLLSQLTRLKRKGFKLVLDDFIISKQHDLYDELYKLVHIIKVDFKNTSRSERLQIEALRTKYRHISLLAEKVETRSEYESALTSGYVLFQGYFFAKPEIIKGKDILANYSLYLYLFQKLNEHEPNVDEISNIIKRDISLSYKLLRHINSLAFNIPNKISSIKQAIMILGLDAAKKWLQILLLYHMGEGDAKGREKALIEHSLTRAKACELLAKYNGKRNSDEFFLLGMFSLINVIMLKSWEDILPKLSLSEEIHDSLLGIETEMLTYLELVQAIEDFNLDEISRCSNQLSISMGKISEISIEAHRWVVKFD